MCNTNNISDVIQLISDIKMKNLNESNDTALRVLDLLKTTINSTQWTCAKDLIDLIKPKLKCISTSLPHNPTSRNIILHILKVIRDEYELAIKTMGISNVPNNNQYIPNFKAALLDHISEYEVELESSYENIATQASEYIHNEEIILTVGKSKTVEMFLISASKTRIFNVIVAEQAPLFEGHTMAANLAENNIQTTVIPDSAIFATMSRINKVIISTHTVLANGGLKTSSGMHMIALAAKHYSVPVIVLAHIYKFSPTYLSSNDDDAFNVCASPGTIKSNLYGQVVKGKIKNTVFDYVPPELITLFITHQGGNAPSYVYRLLSELYHLDDYEL